MLSLRWLGRVRPMGGIARAGRGLARAPQPAVRARAVRWNRSRLVSRCMVWSLRSGRRPTAHPLGRVIVVSATRVRRSYYATEPVSRGVLVKQQFREWADFEPPRRIPTGDIPDL